MNKYQLFLLLLECGRQLHPEAYEGYSRWLRRLNDDGILRDEAFDEIAMSSLFFGTAEGALGEMASYVDVVDKRVKEILAEI
jgi:hypothetical protein